jgi:hypothetical protein
MQKKAIRAITLSKFNDHTAPLFFSEKILPLEYVIQKAMLQFMHTVKFGNCPPSFNDVFVLNNVEEPVYELRYPNDFIVPRARIDLFKRVPLYSLPVEWNNCHDLRFYQNPTTFKIVMIETMFRTWAVNNNLVSEL